MSLLPAWAFEVSRLHPCPAACDARSRRRTPPARAIEKARGPIPQLDNDDYIELLSEVQRASTLVPTVPMTAMAATTIRPAISAYSSTSPPRSSFTNLTKRFFMAALQRYESSAPARRGTVPRANRGIEQTALNMGATLDTSEPPTPHLISPC